MLIIAYTPPTIEHILYYSHNVSAHIMKDSFNPRFSILFYRMWWKLAKRKAIVNFWHHRKLMAVIHVLENENLLKLHINAVHVSKTKKNIIFYFNFELSRQLKQFG